MRTECKQTTFGFHGLLQRKVKVRFDGGKITSDAGVLLLREVEKRIGLMDGLAQCLTDHRKQRLIEHTVKELLGQRVYGLCLGYEERPRSVTDRSDACGCGGQSRPAGNESPTGQ